MREKIFQILFNKFKSKTLAHFYILNSGNSTHNQAKDLLGFISKFIKTVFIKEKLSGFTEITNYFEMGHPDILFLKPSKKNYVKEDFRDFFKFLNFSKYELSWRFIIISDAHLIPNLLKHKLLKSLEEPPTQTTIFFLRPSAELMLKTIESRAIKLRIPSTNLNTAKSTNLLSSDKLFPYLESFYKDEKEYHKALLILKPYLTNNPHESLVLEAMRKKVTNELIYYNIIIHIVSVLDSDYKSKETALNEIKWYQTSQKYNLSKDERFLGLLRSAKTMLN